MSIPVFRFAPSPNGELHLGHAYSALLNARIAREEGGRLLLRVEDIDLDRCTAELADQLFIDLKWLGLKWEEPVRFQSRHFEDYGSALDALREEGLVYPAFMSRGEARAWIAENCDTDWPRDPDGVAHYPPVDRQRSETERAELEEEGRPFTLRLDMEAALARVDPLSLGWNEAGAGPAGETGAIVLYPALWGDVMLGRRDVPASYHLCVVVDDAIQGITDVVRGRDLFHATSVHRLLQELLGLPAPHYRHHDLILGEDGRKLSKSRGDVSLRALREAGVTPADIARMVGLD